MTERPYWLGAGVTLFGLVWVYQGLLLPQFQIYAGIGPGFTVTLVGAILIVLGLILTFQIWRGERFEAQEGEDVDVGQSASWPALLWTFAGAAFPVLAMTWLGFPFTAAIAFTLVAFGFGARNVAWSLTIGLIIGFICFYGFGKLGVQLGDMIPIAGIKTFGDLAAIVGIR